MNVNNHQCQELLIKDNLYMVNTVVTFRLFVSTAYFYKTFLTKFILLMLILCNISLGLIKQKCYYEVDHELIEDSC